MSTPKRLLLIMNPRAGLRRANRLLPELLALFNSHGYENIVYITAGAGDALRIARERAREAELLVCVGGDGTLNEVITGLIAAGANTPLGYIPAGSTNDFGTSLGIPKDIMRAAHGVMNGQERLIDVGSFNGRCFSYVASFGAFTRVSYTTPQTFKNALGHTAYVLEGIKELPGIQPLHLRVETDLCTFEGDYLFGAFSNATSVGGVLTLDPALVDMSDGKFEIMLIKSPTTLLQLQQLVYALQTRQYSCETIEFATASWARVYAAQEIDWSLDGEYEPGSPEIEVRNHRGALRVIVGS